VAESVTVPAAVPTLENMTIQEIRKLGKSKGINTFGKSRAAIIEELGSID
jgi:hypothetical protein